MSTCEEPGNKASRQKRKNHRKEGKLKQVNLLSENIIHIIMQQKRRVIKEQKKGLIQNIYTYSR